MTTDTITTLAAAPAGGSPIGQGVALMIVGMGVVFVALTIIGFVAAVMTRALREQPPDPEPEAVEPAEPGVGVDGRTVAIITAAAAAALHRPVRVRRVTVVGRRGHEAWVSGGRSILLGSHAPRYHR
jgi:sodium pump decarboxylase gamma subunit